MEKSSIAGWTIFLLNVPWTLTGVLAALLSIPRKVALSKYPPAIIFYVRSFWWYRWIPGQEGVRAMATGNVVQMSKWADDLDLKHELIHIEQCMRYPLISGFVLLVEIIKHGSYPPRNRFEKEAYERAGNRFGYFVD